MTTQQRKGFPVNYSNLGVGGGTWGQQEKKILPVKDDRLGDNYPSPHPHPANKIIHFLQRAEEKPSGGG